MNKITKILLSVVGAVIIIGGGWYFWSDSDQSQIDRIAAETRRTIRGYSTTTQQALQYELKELDVSSGQENHPRTEALGISFATPWGVGNITNDQGTAVELAFPNGRKMTIMGDPDDSEGMQSPQEFLKDIDEDLPSGQASSLELFTDKLGSGFSTYDIYKYIFTITPEDIIAAETAKEARLRAYAIILKAGNTLSSTAQVYHFKTDYAKGFWSASDPMGGSLFELWTQDKGYSIIPQGLDADNSQEVAEVIVSTLQPVDGDTLDTAGSNESSNSSDDYFTQ